MKTEVEGRQKRERERGIKKELKREREGERERESYTTTSCGCVDNRLYYNWSIGQKEEKNRRKCILMTILFHNNHVRHYIIISWCLYSGLFLLLQRFTE